MRVIAGLYRSRSLKAPKGTKTRPTTDRVREAIFGILVSAGAVGDGVRVLDLYAGSGALGIEALSRGAGTAVFVEHDREALTTIRDNLRELGIEDQARVVPAKVERILTRQFGRPDSTRVEGPFDVVFLDPPYELVRGESFGALLAAAGRLVAAAGVLVLEHASSDPAPPLSGFEIATRRYGDTAISLYRPRISTGSHIEA